MPTCHTCGATIAVAGQFCSACGAKHVGLEQSPDPVATLEYLPTSVPLRQKESGRASGSVSNLSNSSRNLVSEGRFLPGRLVAGRYRIIALLGRGGMGEVYRADDLTLGQPVALKFLPEDATRDENALERFRNEVRIARRVSHPNVCRVYDVGEVEGNTFFTMEYVDGEDLASLLRRIGRLPEDKALEISRQLCAGLAAAHAKGVLHRDLKPANIMLDGRGQVVITDFGLAGMVEHIQGPDVRSGTPAYMAPEQLEGKEVSVRSDIYSLGLVLYEVFTGKRAFTFETVAELIRSRTTNTPSKPTSLVKDLDPAIERVIFRCLESDPANRPASVLLVASALPGGDPLAAALAAGETPSPQMVAAAGATEGIAPQKAMLCLAAAIVGLLLVAYLTTRTSAIDKMDLDQPPTVLAHKARDIVHLLGYAERSVDSADDIFYDTDFLHYVETNEKRASWDHVLASTPSALKYWYRQSPRYMTATEFHENMLTPGIINRNDPPLIISGMILVELDMHGHLTMFQAIPPQRDEAGVQSSNVDWAPLFDAAGLDKAKFQLTAPTWSTPSSSDVRAAWLGTWPGSDRPLRVEAAAFLGKPVFFSMIGPWTTASVMQPQLPTASQRATQIIFLGIFVSIVGAALFLARRNYLQGRGDRTGAFRLASVIFVLQLLLWLCRGHFVPSFEIFFGFVLAISTGLFFTAITWILYLALEPYIRRRWPQAIISWSRLLMGQFRDPLVGRDLMYGVVLGNIWILIFKVSSIISMHLGAGPDLYSTDFLMGTRRAFGSWLLHFPQSIQATLLFFFMLLLLRVALRKPWLAGLVFVAIWVTLKTLGSDYKWVDIPATTLIYAICLLVVTRFGLVALAAGVFTADLLGNIPFSADFSVWYSPNDIFAFLSVVALAGWGFYHSLAGKRLWKTDLLE